MRVFSHLSSKNLCHPKQYILHDFSIYLNRPDNKTDYCLLNVNNIFENNQYENDVFFKNSSISETISQLERKMTQKKWNTDVIDMRPEKKFSTVYGIFSKFAIEDPIFSLDGKNGIEKVSIFSPVVLPQIIHDIYLKKDYNSAYCDYSDVSIPITDAVDYSMRCSCNKGTNGSFYLNEILNIKNDLHQSILDVIIQILTENSRKVFEMLSIKVRNLSKNDRLEIFNAFLWYLSSYPDDKKISDVNQCMLDVFMSFSKNIKEIFENRVFVNSILDGMALLISDYMNSSTDDQDKMKILFLFTSKILKLEFIYRTTNEHRNRNKTKQFDQVVCGTKGTQTNLLSMNLFKESDHYLKSNFQL